MTRITLVAPAGDHERVRNIVGALSESGLDIFWERTESSDPKWPQATANVLASRAVVLVWSEAALSPEEDGYRILARRAIAAGIAICVRLDGSRLSEGVAGCATYDLRGWRARASSLFMLDLVAAAKAKVAGLDPPLPRAPRQLLLRRLAFVVPSFIGAVALLIGLYRDIGLDRLAGPEEAAAWAALRPGSCDDLRAFLRTHSTGAHAGEAEALLASRHVQTLTRRRRAERPLPIYVPSGAAEASGTEALARSAALTRAVPLAEQLCGRLANTAGSNFVSARVREGGHECDRLRSGVACALTGEAICTLDEPEDVQIEVCARGR